MSLDEEILAFLEREERKPFPPSYIPGEIAIRMLRLGLRIDGMTILCSRGQAEEIRRLTGKGEKL